MQPETSCVFAGSLALWRVDQHAIPDPDIALAGTAIDRVDHLSSDEPGQHGKAFLPGKAPASCRTMFAMLGSGDGAVAARDRNVPIRLE